MANPGIPEPAPGGDVIPVQTPPTYPGERPIGPDEPSAPIDVPFEEPPQPGIGPNVPLGDPSGPGVIA